MKSFSISVLLQKGRMPTFIQMIVLAPATCLPPEVAESAKSPKWVTMQTLLRDTMRNMQINTPGNYIVNIYINIRWMGDDRKSCFWVFFVVRIRLFCSCCCPSYVCWPQFSCVLFISSLFFCYIFLRVVLISIYFLAVHRALSVIVKPQPAAHKATNKPWLLFPSWCKCAQINMLIKTRCVRVCSPVCEPLLPPQSASVYCMISLCVAVEQAGLITSLSV